MTAADVIPLMTDPLGKYWDQPALSEILIDDEVAMMTSRTFKGLMEYSSSIPSGKYPGKCWRSQTAFGWYLRWYQIDPSDEQMLLIPKRKIVLVD